MKKYRIVSRSNNHDKQMMESWEIELRRSIWREHKQYIKNLKKIIPLGDEVQMIPSNNDVASQAITNTLAKLLPQAMSLLNPTEQHIIICYFYNGMDDSTIGRAMGKTKQTINEQRNRALAKMRKFYGIKK